MQAAGSLLAYAYAPDNKRIYKRNSHIDQFGNLSVDNEELYYYSPTGQKLGTYQIVVSSPPSSPSMMLVVTGTKVWFGARPLNGVPDRIGSFGKYYPYGEDKGSSNPANGTEKFATYTRDSDTSLDYADQRYYNGGLGRFTTPDPYDGSINVKNPQSWYRYGDVLDGPANLIDPTGLDCNDDEKKISPSK